MITFQTLSTIRAWIFLFPKKSIIITRLAFGPCMSFDAKVVTLQILIICLNRYTKFRILITIFYKFRIIIISPIILTDFGNFPPWTLLQSHNRFTTSTGNIILKRKIILFANFAIILIKIPIFSWLTKSCIQNHFKFITIQIILLTC